MFSGKVHDLCHFCFGDFVGVNAALANSVMVDMQHDLGCSLPVLVKEPFQNMDNKFHGRVVVIQQQHAVHARPLGLRLGLGNDRSARPAWILALLAVVIRHPRLETRGCRLGSRSD